MENAILIPARSQVIKVVFKLTKWQAKLALVSLEVLNDYVSRTPNRDITVLTRFTSCTLALNSALRKLVISYTILQIL